MLLSLKEILNPVIRKASASYSSVSKIHKLPPHIFGHQELRSISNRAKSEYVQGQSPKKGIREYFYYIDHNGMLFLDDSKMKHFTAAIKEKKMLEFFFSRLKMNETGRYSEFKYFSPCGRERNFVRSDDRPIVFTKCVLMEQPPKSKKKSKTQDGSSESSSEEEPSWYLEYGHAGELLVHKFSPSMICMVPATGRVYHPGPEATGGVGLVADKLAILWTQEGRITFGEGEDDPPTHFRWRGTEYELENKLLEKMTEEERAGLNIKSWDQS